MQRRMVLFVTDAKHSTSAGDPHTMMRFNRWSGIVHASLSATYPRFKLSQAKELLAAGLGHNTYASLRQSDLAKLDAAHYVVLDMQRLLRRADGIGMPLTLEQWWTAHRELTPSGVTGGCYLGEAQVMESAARHVFEDSAHPCFDDIAGRTGVKAGHWSHGAARWEAQDVPIDELAMRVHGSVHALNEHTALATPVTAEIRFPRIGRQLFGEGRLIHAAQHGEPSPYDPIDEVEIYGP